MTAGRIRWGPVLDQAEAIVWSYGTGVTLRQLFYRLVSAQLIPNTTAAYKGLSAKTAEARRDGDFPALLDRTRKVHGYRTFDSLAAALGDLPRTYRRDRTEGQEWQCWVAVEKNALVEQLFGWFGDRGVPVIALGGYSSQTYVDEVAESVDADGRPAVLLYAGDFDPSGEDIDRDFEDRSDCWEKVERVALQADQVTAYGLPPAMGKATDSRAGRFVARHGELVQVELDAVPPDALRDLYEETLAGYWDVSAYEAVLADEQAERAELRRIVEAAK